MTCTLKVLYTSKNNMIKVDFDFVVNKFENNGMNALMIKIWYMICDLSCVAKVMYIIIMKI